GAPARPVGGLCVVPSVQAEGTRLRGSIVDSVPRDSGTTARPRPRSARNGPRGPPGDVLRSASYGLTRTSRVHQVGPSGSTLEDQLTMNKFTLAFALGTGLTLSLAAPPVKADPIINTLSTPSITAAQFKSDF